jgi:hypothetical protein
VSLARHHGARSALSCTCNHESKSAVLRHTRLLDVAASNFSSASVRLSMASVSPSDSSDSNWQSDDASADERPVASAACDDHTDTARNLLVFAADKAGMQVQTIARRYTYLN